MALEIDFVIETSLVAIYSNIRLSEHIYLKGGQALRLKEKLRARFSADIDFSSDQPISDGKAFFEMMEEALSKEFHRCGYCLFDFQAVRQPKIRPEGTPDFWGGWAVQFKLVEEAKRNLPTDQRSREALIPIGSTSPRIVMDISEHEYCGSTERIRLRAADVKVYSRALLLLEKLRAICQQHPEYSLRVSGQRARDYYDIERLWDLVLRTGEPGQFLNECAAHIEAVFEAKAVSMSLLDKIFETEFIELQRTGWPSVEITVSGNLQPFDYYLENLLNLSNDIKSRIRHS